MVEHLTLIKWSTVRSRQAHHKIKHLVRRSAGRRPGMSKYVRKPIAGLGPMGGRSDERPVARAWDYRSRRHAETQPLAAIIFYLAFAGVLALMAYVAFNGAVS